MQVMVLIMQILHLTITQSVVVVVVVVVHVRLFTVIATLQNRTWIYTYPKSIMKTYNIKPKST